MISGWMIRFKNGHTSIAVDYRPACAEQVVILTLDEYARLRGCDDGDEVQRIEAQPGEGE